MSNEKGQTKKEHGQWEDDFHKMAQKAAMDYKALEDQSHQEPAEVLNTLEEIIELSQHKLRGGELQYFSAGDWRAASQPTPMFGTFKYRKAPRSLWIAEFTNQSGEKIESPVCKSKSQAEGFYQAPDFKYVRATEYVEKT